MIQVEQVMQPKGGTDWALADRLPYVRRNETFREEREGANLPPDGVRAAAARPPPPL